MSYKIVVCVCIVRLHMYLRGSSYEGLTILGSRPAGGRIDLFPVYTKPIMNHVNTTYVIIPKVINLNPKKYTIGWGQND